jgi:channel protein (hemolysin III family)
LIAALDTLPIPGFTEPVSSLTHLLGAGVFAVLAWFLLRRGWGNATRVAFLGVYSLACVFLMSMSGVYHLLTFGGTARTVLERLDHGAIFVLIAGTFTPAHGILFRGWGRWSVLVMIWGLAVAGIALTTVFFAGLGEWLRLVFYLALGWLGLFSGTALWHMYGLAFIKPLLWGGLVYTLGALADFLRWPVLIPGVFGSHEVFHVAVLVGAGLHWKFIWQFASGIERQHRAQQPACSSGPPLGSVSPVRSESLRPEVPA